MMEIRIHPILGENVAKIFDSFHDDFEWEVPCVPEFLGVKDSALTRHLGPERKIIKNKYLIEQLSNVVQILDIEIIAISDPEIGLFVEDGSYIRVRPLADFPLFSTFATQP